MDCDYSDTMRQLLSVVPCPNCLGYRLEFDDRSHLGGNEMAEVARCQGCGYPVLFNGRTEKRLRQAVEQLEMGQCPRCRSEETRPEIVCKLRSQHSLILGYCESCRREFAPGVAI